MSLTQREQAMAAFGYEQVRTLPSGECAGLMKMLFTVGLCVGLDEIGYRTRFCYPDFLSASLALSQWDGRGDPPGPWIKEKGVRERNNPQSFKRIPIRTPKVCVYDNPGTMRRECWRDGRLLCFYTAALIESRQSIPPEFLFFGANIGRWREGQYRGDLDAMKPASD